MARKWQRVIFNILEKVNENNKNKEGKCEMIGRKVIIKRGKEQGKSGHIIKENITMNGKVFFAIRLEKGKDIVMPFNDVILMDMDEDIK